MCVDSVEQNLKKSRQPRRGDISIERFVPNFPSPVGAASAETLQQNAMKIPKLTSMGSGLETPPTGERFYRKKGCSERLTHHSA